MPGPWPGSILPKLSRRLAATHQALWDMQLRRFGGVWGSWATGPAGSPGEWGAAGCRWPAAQERRDTRAVTGTALQQRTSTSAICACRTALSHQLMSRLQVCPPALSGICKPSPLLADLPTPPLAARGNRARLLEATDFFRPGGGGCHYSHRRGRPGCGWNSTPAPPPVSL